ncbi:MAG: glycosyltransferase [Desulfobacter postgatei]|uniref:glycosyltransferase family 2 protein n=1 Tax=Desulfobacter postgatei TaxID=2293 RepID=UPI0023F16F5E|nr:glycosyltransferase [Desulfobacter postgatei]MDD4273743.1 glycosyltransferase [Desulfobacter postgatei]
MGNVNVSIIITTYNYEKYIDECITSCLDQNSISEYEIILVDDGSIDDTVSIARKYKNKITIFENENKGVESAANFGIRHAQGKYILRVDADDILLPGYMDNAVKEIEKDNHFFIYTEYFTINEKSEIIDKVILPAFDPEEIRKRGDFLATGTLYRKEQLFKLGLYNEKVKNSGLENYELILSALNKKYNGRCIHEPLFGYRLHDANMSEKKRNSIIRYGEYLSKKYTLETQ